MPAEPVVLVIHALDPGGAEKVLTVMANAWAQRGRPVTVLTLAAPGRESFYPLDPRVARVGLDLVGESAGLWRGLVNSVRRVRALRAALDQLRPGAVVSFLDRTNVLSLLASRGRRWPVLVAEHTDPELYEPGRVWRWLRSRVYPWASAVVVLNRRAARYFAGCNRRVEIVPNPVQVPDATAHPAREGVRIAAMGRLSAEKGFDVLLDATAQLCARFPALQLDIFGDGPLRAELEERASEPDLNGHVHFFGYVSDPHAHIANATLFVSASRLEGFPCALTEAMAMGLPVVASRYHEGIEEIIDNDANGLVVRRDDSTALANAVAELLDDPQRRQRLGAAAAEIRERLRPERVIERWDGLLREFAEAR
ncbi:MAG: glycosyltransferase family 4 protein [Gammaproteobacteria bacterium]|jgi:glycosyltransferase involved in cell wall biosynthesis|nr:glycosyltransferase family 4 protein [Gammaproteobacteria bacterium]